MNKVLLSTAYLPPISWMAVAIQLKDFSIEIHESYPKQTFRNRCNIATSAGILPLSIPVKRTNGNHTKTGDISIDNSNNWQLLHWRSMVTAYSKSPYFLYYRDLFEPVYNEKFDLLIDFNSKLLKKLYTALNISTKEINSTTEYQFKPEGQDLRNSFNPKRNPYQTILAEMPRYIQVFEEIHNFVPDLSIIDLLFNLGPDSYQYLNEAKLLQQE